MFPPSLAAELTERGHDCVGVAADAELRESSDEELLSAAVAAGRALVTNNVVDFERLRRTLLESGSAVPPIIYTSDRTFPRGWKFVGRLIAALDGACANDAVTAAGGVLWLQPARE